MIATHPRSRGEHEVQRHLCTVTLGSSPLARGTPAARSVSKPQLRLIPARAGNTDCSDWLSPRAPAHPRSRGEHSGAITSPSAMVGSSPLARGTRAAEERQRIRFRLIPARAGNTPCRVPGRSGYPAHPRSRGEHRYDKALLGQDCGSSPLTRRTLSRSSQLETISRLIPARAGNTRA